MKTFYFILALAFTLKSLAQDPQLFENEWFLMELIVDGNTIDIPSTNEIGDIQLFLTETRIETHACNTIGTDITDFTNSSFTVDIWSLLVFICNSQSTIDFEDFYFEDFYRFSFPVNNIFTYNLVSGPNDTLTLTITNANGDSGVYGNPALGIEDLKQNAFTLYPNPATEKMYLQLSTGVLAKEVWVYDVQGRLINQEVFNQTNLIEIETASLHAGLYFVQVIDNNGHVSVERFVKE